MERLVDPTPLAVHAPETPVARAVRGVARSSLPYSIADEPPAKPEEEREQRLRDLEGKVDVLTKEIERLRIGEAAAPKSASAPPALGLGPSASKVYAKNGVSIGGYGEILYQNFSGSRENGSASGLTPTLDLARAVLYFGYKFDGHFVFNSEIEYAHAVTASDKGGETEVEFAYLDWLSGKRAFNARAGLVLIPLGLVNQLHEPPVFLGARRPDVETAILPSTWREIGFGAWGDAGPFSYRLYLVNGLNAEGFAADGLREGSQEGSLALARSFAAHRPPRLHGPAGRARGRVVLHGKLRPGARNARRRVVRCADDVRRPPSGRPVARSVVPSALGAVHAWATRTQSIGSTASKGTNQSENGRKAGTSRPASTSCRSSRDRG